MVNEADVSGDLQVNDKTSMPTKLKVENLSIHYGQQAALEGVSLDIREHEIFGIIGPANAGKTSFLKAINRMDMFNPDMKIGGSIRFNGVDVSQVRNVYGLRRRIGVVFPLPVGLPLSIIFWILATILIPRFWPV